MAKDKDKSNPVQQAQKAAKRAAIKKSKSTLAAARQERLAKRDPSRLEKRLASARSSGGNAREIETLERDLAAVRKARSVAGVEDRPPRGGGEGRRERHAHRRERDEGEDGEETDEDVRSIPMPRDTPPPVPRQSQSQSQSQSQDAEKKRETKAQMTYSAAPVLRDLKKESVKFAPAVVRRNIKLAKGEDGVVEEEEFERLERAGYVQSSTQAPAKGEGRALDRGNGQRSQSVENGPRKVQMEDVDDEEDI